MRRILNLRLLSYVVIVYMLLAFGWWSVLLYTKNRDAFQAKSTNMEMMMAAEGLIVNKEQFLQSEPYLNLKKEYTRQEWMIFGETLVFVVTLFVGIWLINRGYNKEVAAARQRRNFLLSITHELKSPIASIRLVLDTFARRELTPEQVNKLTNNGLQETERLHKLVNDLLLSAKLETNYQPDKERLDLVQLLSEIIETIGNRHPEATIDFQVPDYFPAVELDRTGISSVAFNLIENAIKYSPKPANVSVKLAPLGDTCILEVADNGLGISEKDKKIVFEKFYRVGSEDTRKTKGTGLGLYIVDQIVKAHEGTINLRDNQPRGSIFRVTLPTIQNVETLSTESAIP